MQTHYNILAGGEVGRIAALSDGLFAIAATILVLDFHTPEPAGIHSEAELLHALAASAPRLLPWLLSLLTLGIFWLGQQTQLNQLERSNRDLTWLHFLFLTIVTVLPFSTRLLADFLTFRTAFLVYWSISFSSARASTPHGRVPITRNLSERKRTARSRAR
jgi:uncharacterized membrane protein